MCLSQRPVLGGDQGGLRERASALLHNKENRRLMVSAELPPPPMVCHQLTYEKFLSQRRNSDVPWPSCPLPLYCGGKHGYTGIV